MRAARSCLPCVCAPGDPDSPRLVSACALQQAMASLLSIGLLAALPSASKLVLEGAAGTATLSNDGAGALTLSAPKCVDMSNFCVNAHSECKSAYSAPASSVEFSSTAPGHTGNTAYLSLYDDGVLGFRFSDFADGSCVELSATALARATTATTTNSVALAGATAAAPMAGVELRPNGRLRLYHPGALELTCPAGRRFLGADAGCERPPLPCFDWASAPEVTLSVAPANDRGALPTCLMASGAVAQCGYGADYACAPHACTEYADDACTKDAARGTKTCYNWVWESGARQLCTSGGKQCGRRGNQCDTFTYRVKKCTSCEAAEELAP